MPSGTPLPNFQDFMYQTGPAILTSATDLINELQKQKYLFNQFLKGRLPEETVQGGSTIRDIIIFDDTNSFQWINPGAQVTVSNPQISTPIEVGWRFALNNMGWTDQEVELNGALSDMNATARFMQYKKVKRTKESGMWTSQYNGLEAALWYDPNGTATYNEMEGTSGTTLRPYSIPVFINEYTNGLPTNWTTKMGVNPAVNTAWKPYVGRYRTNDLNDSQGTQTGLIDAFEDTTLSIMFEGITSGPGAEYFEALKKNRMVIACSKLGLKSYKQVLRANNDRTLSPQDPGYDAPTYNGIPLTYVTYLDDLAIYPSGSGNNVTENSASATNPGPRYYFINGDYFLPIFHKRYYMKVDQPVKPVNQPDAWLQYVRTWTNNFCRSNRRHGIVAPGA